MVRSMIAGVAGLRTHQSKLDVIGNNIANVNTWGFRSSSFNFLDSMYSTSINGSAGSTLAGAAGGRNASQVGYGVTTGSIIASFTQGAPAPSAENLDCMIDGTGFFLVGPMVNGSFTDVASSGLSLSRIGIFRVDSNGYLVDDQRNYVYGYALVDGTGIPEKPATKAVYTLSGLQATIDNTSTPKTVTIGGITYETNQTKFVDQINDWIKKATADDDPNNPGNPSPFAGYRVENLEGYDEAAGTVNLRFTAKTAGVDTGSGAISGLGGTFAEVTTGEAGEPAIPAVYSDSLSTLQIPYDPDTGNRYEIQSYKINEDGTIMGVDNQSRTIAIGQLALVTVENPNGLEKTSGYYYSVGANAGQTVAIKPNGGPAGKIRGNYLEMANVDLANEFSQMITTQRGYQANSKIITVTDQMLEELVNMKR